jgi:hypothetical protein
MEYSTLSNDDLLLIARDALRGRESDHYRLTLVNEPNKQFRLAELEANIAILKAEIADREAAADDQPAG